MSKRKRRSYDDNFRASAVVMLEAAGYPSEKGALTKVANHLKVPARTLSRWFNGENNPPPDNIVKEKSFELADLLRTEIDAIFQEMPKSREDASFKDLGTVAGILIDKLQLVTGGATSRIGHEDWRAEAIALIKSGDYTYAEVAEAFNDRSLADELFREAGIPTRVGAPQE